jgi:hypothetical protein
MPNIYMFFDGSSLITQIRQLQGKYGRFKGRKLRSLDLVSYFDDAVITDQFEFGLALVAGFVLSRFMGW